MALSAVATDHAHTRNAAVCHGADRHRAALHGCRAGPSQACLIGNAPLRWEDFARHDSCTDRSSAPTAGEVTRSVDERPETSTRSRERRLGENVGAAQILARGPWSPDTGDAETTQLRLRATCARGQRLSRFHALSGGAQRAPCPKRLLEPRRARGHTAHGHGVEKAELHDDVVLSAYGGFARRTEHRRCCRRRKPCAAKLLNRRVAWGFRHRQSFQ